MFDAWGMSRIFASQLGDPDCADSDEIAAMTTLHASHIPGRRCISAPAKVYSSRVNVAHRCSAKTFWTTSLFFPRDDDRAEEEKECARCGSTKQHFGAGAHALLVRIDRLNLAELKIPHRHRLPRLRQDADGRSEERRVGKEGRSR